MPDGRDFLAHKWRNLVGCLAAILMTARAVLPMDVVMPPGFSQITICGAHGIETVLLDQNMNRVNPDAPQKTDSGHCGICTLVFGLAWAIALTLSLAPVTSYVALRRDDVSLPQRDSFSLAFPRAPPRFA